MRPPVCPQCDHYEACRLHDNRPFCIPLIWGHDPEIWFNVLEAAFTFAHIYDEERKFQRLLMNLDRYSVPLVYDLIQITRSFPPTMSKYKFMKTNMIIRFKDSISAER